MVDREPASSGAPQLSHLRRAAASGVRWISAKTVVVGGAQLAQLAVLAQVLDATELGQIGILLVIIAVGQAVVDFGLSGASIARQTTDPPTLNTLFWSNGAIGALAGAVLLAIGTPLANLFSISALPGYLPWIAVGLLLGGLSEQPKAYLQRGLQFRQLATMESIGSVVGGVVTITAALAGAGVVSLALGFMSSAAIRLILLLASNWRSWRPRLAFHPFRLRGHLSFGAYFTGFRFISTLSANLDYVLIGYFLGPAALGPYTLAYEMTAKPFQRINPAITRVAFPIYARRQADDAVLRRGLLETNRLVAFVVVPIVAGIAVLAPDLVPTLFGDGWEQTVDLLPILAVVGALKALEQPAGSVFLAKQRPDISFKLSIFVLVSYAVGFTLAAQESVTAVAVVFVALMVVYFLVRRLLLWRLIGLSLGEYVRTVSGALALSAGAVVIVLGAEALLAPDALGSAAARLVVLGALFVGSFAALVAVFQRRYVGYLWTLARSRGPTSAELAEAAPPET